MSKVQLVFSSSDVSEHDSKMVCYVNHNEQIFIEISTGKEVEDCQWICLDIYTAIKFSKVLRTEIAKAKEGGEDV